jgi:cytosine/adenosine deaminase-related metal-dependent hydrolase
MTLDILVKNVALWGTKGLCDLGIAGGKFVSVGQGAATSPAALTLDAEGRMAVPGFVEPHIHLDKALISERAPVNISGTLTEAIEILWISSAITPWMKSPIGRRACSAVRWKTASPDCAPMWMSIRSAARDRPKA